VKNDAKLRMTILIIIIMYLGSSATKKVANQSFFQLMIYLGKQRYDKIMQLPN